MLVAPAQGNAVPAALSAGQPGQAESHSLLLQVQHRPHVSQRGGYHHDGGGDGGAVAAGAIFGLILGGIIANQAQRQQAIDYCSRRFRSFDPNSMTYLGRDGFRHRCL